MKSDSLIIRAARQIVGEKRRVQIARWIEHLDPRYRESMRRIRKFHNIHRGKRCFVVGNGPSLKQTDLSLLADEYTFCTNRIYLMAQQMGFTPSYYVVANDLVVEQCAEDIEKLSMPKFVGWHNRDMIRFTKDMAFLWTRSGLRSWFFTDLTEGCWEGNTVTMVAIQLAYYMGFSEVYLIGVDHSYQFKGTPHAEQVSGGDDPNHFAPNYFGKGFRWHLPDLEGSELAYRVAKHVYETTGRRIFDATVGGKLEVFPKVAYGSLFERSVAA
ncbi:MAG TPA: 6-hydroxymethylpterin diphosphokinase MptE-like protein [Tepidisphaeraceae bacterium]|jgi:hypothetical protein|nr:6-hydroxymethylpterin diphosphokinase MptE-like protein [Tepidisphaeraceae bacterium]